MPMDEPSRGGLTISGRPSSSGTAITASRDWLRRQPAQRGVGRPSATHTRLVITLSIAMALAITPLPV
jgi:hypothetical protein